MSQLLCSTHGGLQGAFKASYHQRQSRRACLKPCNAMTNSRTAQLRQLLQGPGILQGRYVNEATKSIPIIGDGDTGYGNAMNVKRTVRGYANAGFAGILIEDQLMPKACGHTGGRKVASRQEAVARIRAAVDARQEGADILIVARTDARQAESLDEALWRVAAFADAGADILFVDALESVEEMRAFCNVARNVPKMASMLEGGGKTPVLPPARLEELGFKLVAYPLSLLGVSIRAMELALEGLKEGRVPSTASMGSFLDIQRAVGFPEYYSESARYASGSSGMDASPVGTTANFQGSQQPLPVVEPEVASPSDRASASSSPQGTIDTDVVALAPTTSEDRSRSGDSSYRRNNFLRVRIADLRTGMVKLETRIPAGFLQGLGSLVPQAAGMNIEGLIKQAIGEQWDINKPLVDFSSGTDNIKIYLE